MTLICSDMLLAATVLYKTVGILWFEIKVWKVVRPEQEKELNF